jgi:hypothetical protein
LGSALGVGYSGENLDAKIGGNLTFTLFGFPYKIEKRN